MAQTSGANGLGRAPARSEPPEPAPAPADAGRPSKELAIRKEQFEALAMPLANLLYATALRLIGNAAKAEDLVQETYVRAWQNFDRFTLGTNFKAWIFRILTFLYKNERRSAKSREVAVDFMAGDAIEAPGPPDVSAGGPRDVDWDALYGQLVDDRLKHALDHLDEDQRAVLMLVTLGELSYQECAESLGIPIGTVMSRLFRARQQLQNELYEYARKEGLIAQRGASEGVPDEG